MLTIKIHADSKKRRSSFLVTMLFAAGDFGRSLHIEMKIQTSIYDALKELKNLPLKSNTDLNLWHKQADIVIQKIRSLKKEEYDQLPHFIEHYLSDADIRLKDQKYKEIQDNELNQFLNKKKK